MQEINIESTKGKKSITPIGLDIDDFDFKPVTSGLGFHHESKTEHVRRPKRAGTSQPVTRARVTEKEYLSISLPEMKQQIPKEEITVKPVKLKTARMGLQLTSFVFDLAIIALVQGLLNFTFLKISNLGNFEQFILFTWLEQLIFFSFSFLFYFTILDLVASPGKKMLSLRLVSTTKGPVRIDQTLIRAVVTLVSFITLLMPLVFDFQGKLSDTRLIEND